MVLTNINIVYKSYYLVLLYYYYFVPTIECYCSYSINIFTIHHYPPFWDLRDLHNDQLVSQPDSDQQQLVVLRGGTTFVKGALHHPLPEAKRKALMMKEHLDVC